MAEESVCVCANEAVLVSTRSIAIWGHERINGRECIRDPDLYNPIRPTEPTGRRVLWTKARFFATDAGNLSSRIFRPHVKQR